MAKSLSKVDETLSGVFISVFSRKLLIRKYEYVQTYDAFVSLNASHLEKHKGHSGSLCTWSTRGILALTKESLGPPKILRRTLQVG